MARDALRRELEPPGAVRRFGNVRTERHDRLAIRVADLHVDDTLAVLVGLQRERASPARGNRDSEPTALSLLTGGEIGETQRANRAREVQRQHAAHGLDRLR